MKITELINVNNIIISLNSSTKEEAIKEMVNKLSNEVVKDKNQLLKDVLLRESQTTTGIGKGIAIPHAKSESMMKTSIVFAKSNQGIEYEAIDEKPVNLLFLLAVEKEGSNQHLALLSKLSKLLMNGNFKQDLLNTKTPQEVLDVISKYDNPNLAVNSKPQEEKKPSQEVNIIAVTACPTGIAHTYMAQEALEKAAKILNVKIKIETNGASGVENKLTQDDIQSATGVILAVNRNVEVDRFNGKKVIMVGAQEAINNAELLITNIINGKAEIFISNKNNSNATNSNFKSISNNHLNNFYKHLMTGVSYMLPFVISGGILIALAFLFDKLSGIDSGSGLGSTTYLAQLFMTIGKQAFSLFIPILGAFIAFSIFNRTALTAGFVAGSLAVVGGSGFLGAIAGGFVAGYVTKFIVNLLKNTPKSLDGIKTILIYPILTVLITGLFMVIVLSVPVKYINDGLNAWLSSMSDVNAVLLGIILGGMMAIDMGGPFNKAAYVFAIASLSQGASSSMAAVMVGGMVPPLAIALATTLFKNKFTLEQREAGKTNYIMGLSFITEGAIPFVASDPIRMIPICMVGSAIAGGLTMFFHITLPAPHGGLIVMFLSNHFFLYFLALVIGSIISALLIGLFKKKGSS